MADVATGLLRPRFFERQSLQAADLALAIDYARERLRRHNRYLHGWGAVCGALVTKSADPWQVLVSEGFVVTPLGDEVAIPAGVPPFDIRAAASACLGLELPCADPEDPAPTGGVEIRHVYLAVYAEDTDVCPQPAVPERCQPPGGRYDFSRTREGYRFALLCALPPSHQHQVSCATLESIVCGSAMAPCPAPLAAGDDGVVLAAIAVNDAGIVDVDNTRARRRLFSESLLQAYLRCHCGVIAAFTASPQSGLRPLEVHFTDQSKGDITTWEWHFGDIHGTTSTLTNPTFTYGGVGFFEASLKVSGPGGTDTHTQIIHSFITFTSTLPDVDPADFDLERGLTLSLDHVRNIGAARMQRLRAAGVHSVLDLLNTAPEQLAQVLGITLDAARQLQADALLLLRRTP